MNRHFNTNGSGHMRARLVELDQILDQLDGEQQAILQTTLDQLLPVDRQKSEGGAHEIQHVRVPSSEASQQQATEILDALPVMAWRSGGKKEYAYVNRAWQVFTGKQLFQAQSASRTEFIHPHDRERYRKAYQSAWSARQIFEIEYRLIHSSGEYRWVLDIGRPDLDDRGKLLGFVGTCFDLSIRKGMEKALRESEARFKGLFEFAPDAVIVTDVNGRIQLANQNAVQMFGYNLVELVGEPIEKLMPEDVRDRHRQHVSKYFRSPRWRPMGERLPLLGVRKDGSTFPVEITLGPLQTGSDLVVLATIRDVTHRKETEQALRNSEARFRKIFTESTIGIILIDPNGQILEANPALLKMLGRPIEEMIGKPYAVTIYPEDSQKSQDVFSRILQGKAPQVPVEIRYMHASGEPVWVKFSGSLFHENEGDPSMVLGMLEDFTAQKQVEAELAEVSRRLIDSAELERLNLSQDLHDGPIQDLQAIQMHLAGIQNENQDVELGSTFQAIRSEVQQVLQSLRSLCGELRPPSLAPFGLEKAIRSHAKQVMGKYAGIQIDLDLMPDRDLLNERVRLALFRIYQHMLTNALRHSEADLIKIHFYYDENEVHLDLQDNGIGFSLPKRWLQVVRSGHYGLVGSMERAESIGGHLDIETAPGKGTIVRVVVPRQEDLQIAVRERFTALSQY
jgi:PAS domain S-box-containing protein